MTGKVDRFHGVIVELVPAQRGESGQRQQPRHHGEEGDDAQWAGSDVTPGREPEMSHLRSVVGLVWRSVVVWLLLLALLTFARLLG